jgi:ureidoacrylate peracid hydrolase
MVKLSAKPEPVEINLKQTAIVIVDMQNAFASKGGMFDLAGYEISGATHAIALTGRLIDASRTAGVHVVFLVMTYQPDLSDGGGPSSPNYHKELGLRMMRSQPELQGKQLVENTWDWRIVDGLEQRPGDQVVKKTRYSGFCHTDLDGHLRARGIRYVLFTGIVLYCPRQRRQWVVGGAVSGVNGTILRLKDDMWQPDSQGMSAAKGKSLHSIALDKDGKLRALVQRQRLEVRALSSEQVGDSERQLIPGNA